MKKLGEQFLHQKDTTLHTTKHVEHEVERKKRKGEGISQKPAEKLAGWLNILKETHTGHREDHRVAERIKQYYHKQYVIKPDDIPESYFENQKRLAREQGHGDIAITQEMRDQLSDIIIKDQKTSLNKWINYFTSSDSDSYPMWVKYWAFTGMLNLSTFNKEKQTFSKRTKNTVAPFADLNMEALAKIADLLVKKINKENISITDNNPKLKQLLEGANFGKLYAFAILETIPTKEKELANIEGEWIKYPQNSDFMPLTKSLEGHSTGWCTAAESTAEAQLKNGDFYVYYSYDKDGKPTIPRSAIRMQGNSIAEVRGIAESQNLDPYIGEVVNNKLADFSDGKVYQKKSADMKRLTEIDNKNNQGLELTKNDLRFLYEIDSPINGFGYSKDPRIAELLDSRDIKEDISNITGYAENEISITQKEALKGNIKYHHGNLDLGGLQSADGLKLPEHIGGGLNLSGLQSADGLKLPEHIGGGLNLSGLKSADGLKLPEHIGGGLFLSGIQSADGLKLPEYIGGNLGLDGLQSADGLKLPEHIGGGLFLNSIQSADGLKLPEHIGGGLFLNSIQSADGLKLPEYIGGNLGLDGLQSADGLKLPEHIGGSLYLKGIQSADGLKLPEHIGGGLFLNSIQSADGLKLPEHIGGSLYLDGLQSADGLKLPEHIGDSLFLNSIQSADGLKLPEHIGGGLFLNSIQSADGLKLPEHIGGSLYLDGLQSADGLKLPEHIGDSLYLKGIQSAEKEKLKQKYPQLHIF